MDFPFKLTTKGSRRKANNVLKKNPTIIDVLKSAQELPKKDLSISSEFMER